VMTGPAIRDASFRMKSRRPLLTRDRLKISLGRRRLRMSSMISEGRSQKVAFCLEAAAFWWRFFCKRSRRLERSGRVAVLSINGSSAPTAGDSLRIAAFVRGALVMVIVKVETVESGGRWMFGERESKVVGFSGVMGGASTVQ